MTRITKAYNELVGLLLNPEDQEKFEWVIGAMLSGGPPNMLVIRGEAASGKTTLTTIVRKLLLSPSTANTSPCVAFEHSDNYQGINPDAFTFVEMNHHSGLELDAIVIQTTGNRVPVNKHYVLMQAIDLELVDIGRNCIALYEELGEGYYDTFQENNR